MKTNSFPLKTALFCALFLCAFTENHEAQNLKPIKVGEITSGSSAGDRNLDRDRRGVVETNAVKTPVRINPSVSNISEMERQTFGLINQKRAELGLSALVWNEDAARIARLHSENMVKFNFFSHVGADGLTVDDRADSVGLGRWSAIGENIAYNRGYAKPVETAVENWLQSQGHRKNLLNNEWRETGIGIAVNTNGAFYFTQVFLQRR